MKNFTNMTTAELVTFYNTNSGKPAIKKFSDRATAEKRCAALPPVKVETTPVRIDSRVKLPVAPAPKSKSPKKVVSQGEKVAPAPAKKVVSQGEKVVAHNSVLGLKIKVIAKTNPKKGTAALRYDLYEDGMTVEEYVSAGGQVRDVCWDRKQGWISTK